MKSLLKRALTSAAVITVFAFSVRMFLLYMAWHNIKNPVKENLPFGYETGQVARSIAAGHGFSSPLRMVDTGPTAWFVPIYPYLLAGIFKLCGIYSDLSHIVIETINCAFAGLTVIPIYSAAKRTFGTGAATAASWMWTFLPTALFFPITWVWDTSMTALFFALILWATLGMRERRDVPAWLGYGALWATGVSINPSLLSVFPFFLAWLVWHLKKESPRWMAPAAATVLIFTLGLVPWTVRNYRVFHKLIVLRSNFGLELWLGNNPAVPTDWAPWMHPNDNLQEAKKYKAMGEIPYMEEKEREAFSFMRSHPAATLQFMFHRFIDNWMAISDSPLDSWSYDPLYVKAFIMMNGLLSVSCLIGVLAIYRLHKPDAFPYAIVVLVFPLVFYLTHSSLRYRFPMDPIMMILSAGALSQLPALVRWRPKHIPQASAARSLPTN